VSRKIVFGPRVRGLFYVSKATKTCALCENP
jgi:hypothetical protein